MPDEPIAARSTSQPKVSVSLVAADRGESPKAEVHFGAGQRWELAGDGSAPSPVEALLAALAACQVITYRHWAARLGGYERDRHLRSGRGARCDWFI